MNMVYRQQQNFHICNTKKNLYNKLSSILNNLQCYKKQTSDLKHVFNFYLSKFVFLVVRRHMQVRTNMIAQHLTFDPPGSLI